MKKLKVTKILASSLIVVSALTLNSVGASAAEWHNYPNNLFQTQDKTVAISLKGNPSTGYTWEYIINDPSIIKLDSKVYIPDNVSLPGSPGTYIWRFSALKEGTTEVTFNYRRPWESTIAETKTYIFTVDSNLIITVKEK